MKVSTIFLLEVEEWAAYNEQFGIQHELPLKISETQASAKFVHARDRV